MATWRRSPSELEANGLSQGTVLTLAPFCKSFAPAANNDLGGSLLQECLLTNCLLHWCGRTKYLLIFKIQVLTQSCCCGRKRPKPGSGEKDRPDASSSDGQGWEQQQNLYRQDTLHPPPAQPVCKIGILMTIAAVGTWARSIRRVADASTDTDNRCSSAVGLSFAETDTLSDADRWGARARALPHSAVAHARSLALDPSPQLPPSPASLQPSAKLPSNSPRCANRRCYMWTGCQNDSVNPQPARWCLKMLTHCVWGTNVLLEVMEAFSLFLALYLY